MGNHVGSQITAPRGEQAIEDAEGADHEDVFPALIAVSYAEDHALENHRDRNAS